MAKLQMFPTGEDKKQYAARQALHDEQLRQEQIAREALYDKSLSRADREAKRLADIAEAEEADAAAIAASDNYKEKE